MEVLSTTYTQFLVTASMCVIPEGKDIAKTATEKFLVDADTFTMAEACICAILDEHSTSGYASKNHHLLNIRKIEGAKYSEIYDREHYVANDHLFDVTIAEKNDNGKDIKSRFLVRADSIEDAKDIFFRHYAPLDTTRIISIKETKILEYFKMNN